MVPENVAQNQGFPRSRQVRSRVDAQVPLRVGLAGAGWATFAGGHRDVPAHLPIVRLVAAAVLREGY